MGRLIPAGTGMEYYRRVKVPPDPTMTESKTEEIDDTQSYIDAMVAATNARSVPEPEPEFEEFEEEPEIEFEDAIDAGGEFELPEPDFEYEEE
jgi:hypothetical protein